MQNTNNDPTSNLDTLDDSKINEALKAMSALTLKSVVGNAMMYRMLAIQGDLPQFRRAINGKNVSKIVNEKGLHNEILIHNASFAGNTDIVKFLVEECQSPINVTDEEGHTPIHNAAHEGHREIIQYLASRPGCLLEVKDKNGRCPIHFASQNGHYKVVELLVSEMNCQVDVKDSKGVTPIQLASGNGHVDIIELLYKSGANPNHTDADGRTSLHSASQEGQLSAVKYLCSDCGADYMKSDLKHRVTSLHLAANNGHIELVKFLCEQPNINPDCKDKYGHTPLHYACQDRHQNVVRYLVEERGCDPLVADQKGITPVDIAIVVGDVDIVEFLRSLPNVKNSTTGDNEALVVNTLAARGDLDKLKQALSNNSFNEIYCGPQKETALHLAAYGGHL